MKTPSILLQFRPILQVLNPDCFHFIGGSLGNSLISNSMIIVGLLLSMFSENSVTSPIGIGLLKILLKNELPSKSFQKFIFCS